jgi:hypothetical protein
MTSKAVFWYYKSNVNPLPNISTTDSNLVEWTKYRDIEIDLIEEAYQNNRQDVLLDRYRIDFNHSIQINLNDETKQRPIKREIGTNHIECLREDRFASTLSTIPSSSSSFGSFDSWCPFLIAWFNTPFGKRAVLDFSHCIEACAQGIIREGALHSSHSKAEAAYMAEKIRQYAKKPRIEVSKQCIRFYTKNTFLYYVLNQALREHDCSKLETLGPFCFLMRNYSRVSKDHIGRVYRGMGLTNIEIEAYKQHIGEWKTWPAYTSTSKDEQAARMFGNTLFVIEITYFKPSPPCAYDIAHISHYPHEQEVLIPAGVSFQILKVEQDISQNFIIHVKV